MSNNYESDEYLEYLILNGYVEVAGIDEDSGDFLYTFTESARETIPGLNDQLNDEFYSLIVYLWEHGFVTMDIESQNPRVTISEKALDQEQVEKLPSIYKSALHTIIEALRIQ